MTNRFRLRSALSAVFVAAASLHGASNAIASGGDLRFDVDCVDQVSGPTNLRAHGVMYIGNERFETWAEGWGEVTIDVWGNVAADTEDRFVSCDVEWFYGDAGSWYYLWTDSESLTLLGSGPGSGTLKFSAFIPYNWVGNPADIYRLFAGDDRGFAPYNVTSRAVTIYDIANPAVNDFDDLGPPYHEVGMTEEYHGPTSLDAPMPFGRITQQARDDWAWDPPMKTRWGTASTSSMACYPPERLGPTQDGTASENRTHCFGSASNPLVAGAPAIDWDLTFTLRWGLNKVVYTVEGCHDGFPAYEAYLNGHAMFQDSDNGDPWSLFPPCDVSVNQTGEVPK